MLPLKELENIFPSYEVILDDGRRVSICSNFPESEEIIFFHNDKYDSTTYDRIAKILPYEGKAVWVGSLDKDP